MKLAAHGRGPARDYWPFVPKNADEARQGENSGKMPWVLGGSLFLIIAAFSTIFAFTAIFSAHQ